MFSLHEFYPANQCSFVASQTEHQHFSWIYLGTQCFLIYHCTLHFFETSPFDQIGLLSSLTFQYYWIWIHEISFFLSCQCFSLVCPSDRYSSSVFQSNQYFLWIVQLYLHFSWNSLFGMVAFPPRIWIFWDVVSIQDRVPNYSDFLLWAIKVHISVDTAPTIACHESNQQPHQQFPEESMGMTRD